MKSNEKCDVADDSSSFSCLPDEMVLQVLNKLVDLKILCLCKLVSKRFGRILHQVDTISFTSFSYPRTPLTNPPTEKWTPTDNFASLGSYWSAMKCLANFGRLKSLRIQVPFSFDNHHLLFKLMIKFGIRVDSFVFLSPNSVFANKESYVNANGQEEEDEDMELLVYHKKFEIACHCLKDVAVKFMQLMRLVTVLPLLQDVSITDPDQKVKFSLNGEKVAEMRSVCEAWEPKDVVPHRISVCNVPLLKLPVSGYVMKGVTLILFGRNDLLDDDIDSFMKIDLNAFEDKEEAAYHEAVIEIVKKHRSRIVRFT